MKFKRIHNKVSMIKLLMIIAVFSSCQKDLELFVPDPITGPDSTWQNIITASMPVSELKTNLLINATRDSVTLTSNGATLLTGSGLQCTFPAGVVTNTAGQSVNGLIQIKSFLVRKKGDFIRMSTPTISDEKLLVSGGAFFLELAKNGEQLQLSQSGINVQYGDSPVSGMMNVFAGDESDPSKFNWLPLIDSFNIVSSLSQGYDVLTNRLKWINCDYFYDTTGTIQTVVSAVLPSNYTNVNSMAYIVFNDMRSVVGMYGDASTRKFSSGRLPVNKAITMVIISKQGNDYFLGHIAATTTGTPGTIGFQQLEISPVITTLDSIKSYLDSL